MPIKFKLVGQSNNNKYYEIIDNFEGEINLNLLQDLFKFHGLDSDDIEKIRFITDSEQIKNSEKCYTVKATEDRGIFVFTAEQDIRIKLQEIFMKNGQPINITLPSKSLTETNQSDQVQAGTIQPGKIQSETFQSETFQSETFQPLTNVEKVEPVMTGEIIDTMNKKTMILFSQPDFKSLLNIYLTNPGIFTVFSKYVQHGDIVSNSSECDKDLTPEKQEEYNKLAATLEEFNLGKSREYLLERLVKYSGHLNLTLRSILSE